MLTYEETLENVQRENEKRMERLTWNKDVFPVAHKLANMWTENHDDPNNGRLSTVEYLDWVSEVTVEIYLSENESFKAIQPLLDLVEENSNFRLIASGDLNHIIGRFWWFRYKDGGSLHITARADKSTKCRFVGSGEFQEKMKIVCED